MSQRAEELASQFETINGQFRDAVEAMSDSQWRATTEEEGWPVGVAAHHAAIGHVPLSGMVRAAADGEPLPPITPEQLNEINAQHARDFASVSRGEVISALDTGVPPTAALIRSLSDEQLQRGAETPFGGVLTTDQIIANVLIGHVQQHLASILAAR
jgi:hypothetical protein